MQLPDIKQLRDLLKLLRSQGVLQYQSTDLNLVLSEHAPISKKSIERDYAEASDDELSPEEEAERLLFYSATSPAVQESES